MKNKTRAFLILAMIGVFMTLIMAPLSLAAAVPDVVFDDMEHGNPSANDWFTFGGSVGGGGIDANSTDLPPDYGGAFSLQTGWGSGGVPGFFGGFGRTNPTDLTGTDHFNFWINPDPGQDYTLEINLQDDDNGDDAIAQADDDEFQYNCVVSPTGPCAISGGGWQQVSIPLADFFDDGSFLFGGNGVLDAVPVSGGGNGQLANVVVAVIGNSGSDATFRTDYWVFSGGSLNQPSVIIDDFENGLPTGVDGDGVPIGFITFSDGSSISIAITDAPPAPVPGSAAGNNVLAMTGNVTAFAGFVHAFENTAVDTWTPQDWSSYEGLSFWLYGQNTGVTLFVDVIDNRNPGSTRDDGERFTVSLVDDFSGWQLFKYPFASFVRKDIGNGAPNDGFTLTQVHGWALGTLNTPREVTYYVDDAAVYGVAEIPDLAVTFASADYNVTEGTSGQIAVKLNRPMNSSDPAQVSVDYATEPGSATIGQDYAPTSGTLTFVNGGPSELTFSLETFEDSKFEGGESVILRLSNPVNVAAGFSFQAGASIQDNDPYDANLLDDFEKGAYLWDANALVRLETAGITHNDPLAIPGQDAFETILQVSPTAAAAKTMIEAAYSDLNDLYPTGNFRVDLWLFLARHQLDRSLRSTNWENEYYLDNGQGASVFSHMSVAITNLRLASLTRGAPTAEIELIIDDLVDSAAALAQNQLDLAVASGGNGRLIDQAQAQMDKAADDVANGRLISALARYRTAWTKSVAALRNVEPAAASFNRDFALGQDWSHGEALTFSYYGSNSGEEVTVNLKENRAPDPGPAGWNMVWSEEFNEPAGTPPNPEYWSYEIGDGTVNGIPGWGNDEFQFYTDAPANAATDGSGNMVLTVREADGSLQCYYGPCDYTSARLISWRKAEFAYGRIESRIQVPGGEAGLWPAFWSLGTDIDVVNWPQTGEIDFMEYVSRLPNEIFGTIHGPGYSGGQSFGRVYDFSGPVADDYHTFTIEWQPDRIDWYVDGILYHTATPADVAPNEWVFNDPIFLLLNVAIGGNFGGTVDPNLQLPQSMAVDYIRVYQGPDTAERFETSFVDNFTGWQQVEIPFTNFVRSAGQPAGAPNDGLSFEEVWGYGFSLPAGSAAALDQVRVKPVPPPTTLTVTTLADSSDGSLRDSIGRIAPGGTITFDPALAGGTIALTSGQLNVARSMTIDGSGAPGLTVSGSSASRVFQMAAGTVVNLNDLTVADGVGAPQGGGILNYGVLNLENVVVMNNAESSTGAPDFQLGGGGIYNGDGATLNMNNSAVMNNSTLGQPGGGIYGFFNSSITLTNSTVSGNVAGDVAGGLRTLGNVTIVNSTISGNVSTAWHGGAMFSTDGAVTILNSTIVGNTAPGGTAGGLMIATFGAPVTATIQNSLIADNGTYNCQLEGNPALASLTSLGNNVVTDGSCQPVGSDIVVAPGGAGVDVLANNGGPTLTHALLPGSVAIDAANTAVCPSTDQRGIIRDAACDIGAFEFVP